MVVLARVAWDVEALYGTERGTFLGEQGHSFRISWGR